AEVGMRFLHVTGVQTCALPISRAFRRDADQRRVTRCPSPTPSGLGLGPPNPSLISIATEPSGIRWEGFSPSSRYSCQHSHSWPLQVAFQLPFTADHDAPLPYIAVSAASVPCLSPGGLSAPQRIDQ